MSSVCRLIALPAVLFLPAARPLSCAERVSAAQTAVVLERDFSNRPVPVWSNGYFLTHTDERMPAKLLVLDRAGRTVREIGISLPGAVSVSIGAPPAGGYAASPGGRFAVAGAAMTAGGGTAFVAIVSPAGAIERIIRTWPFSPYQVLFGPDETLWVTGREMSESGRAEPVCDILRHYDLEGRLLGSMLPSDSFVSLDGRHPATETSLVCAKDRIGLYSVPASEWIEISPRGDLLGRWRMPVLTADMITGVAMTRSGWVYVSVQNPGGTQPRAGLYRLDRQRLAWVPVDTGALGRARPVLGADGEQLVVSAGLPKAAWITLARD